jgi:hypothetical protein
VRNALFRSMMDRRKLRESDLRPSRTVLGPTYVWAPRPEDPAHRECRDTISIDGGPEMNAYSFVSPEYVAACRALATPPEPHPWVRLWRRLVWGA